MSIRPVKRVIQPRPTLEGAGVHLRRGFGFGDPKEFDPFLLFDLRGLSRAQLRRELEASPLGRILASELEPHMVPLVPAPSYYTIPSRHAAEATVGYQEFWTGPRRPPETEAAPRASVPALLVKKGGDYPPFWHKDGSFIGTMEELYERVRTRHNQLK